MIKYETNVRPSIEMIIELYKDSGLKRPVENEQRIAKMFENSNLVVSAWDGKTLVGIARSLSDFSYCCYLSDLAVKRSYQQRGIGRQLINLTKQECGEQTMLLLLSAPKALAYYPAIGFRKVENGFIIDRTI